MDEGWIGHVDVFLLGHVLDGGHDTMCDRPFVRKILDPPSNPDRHCRLPIFSNTKGSGTSGMLIAPGPPEAEPPDSWRKAPVLTVRVLRALQL